MFEKKAEEYANIVQNHKLNCNLGNDVMANRITLLDIQDAFENGAEYGYNKAMEENKKSALNGLVDAMNTWR